MTEKTQPLISCKYYLLSSLFTYENLVNEFIIAKEKKMKFKKSTI